jgi:hypothetical protein
MRGDIAINKVSIASGATKSDAVDIRGYAITAIEMPSAFTGTAITLEAARAREGTYKQVTDDGGTAVSLTVAASKVVALAAADSASLRGLPFIKLVSGSAEAAAREVWLYLIPEG